MNKTLLLATTAAILCSTPAFAQDEEPRDNGGLRIEARVGLDRPSIGFDGDSASESAVSYGGEIGYDLAVSNGLIVGAYAGVDGSSLEECTEVFGDDEACLKMGRNITVGARFGGAVGPGLLYVKGGYSNGLVTIDYDDFLFPANSFAESDDLDGIHIGAGYEVDVTGSVYAKAEYLYTNYSNSDVFDLDVHRHQLLFGVGMRF